jgi:hypothetical protein
MNVFLTEYMYVFLYVFHTVFLIVYIAVLFTRTLYGVCPCCGLPNDQRRLLSSLPVRAAEPMRSAEKEHSVQMKRASSIRARARARLWS